MTYAESIEAALDQSDAQPHGGDGTEISRWAAPLRLEVEMGARAVNAHPRNGIHVGKDLIQQCGGFGVV